MIIHTRKFVILSAILAVGLFSKSVGAQVDVQAEMEKEFSYRSALSKIQSEQSSLKTLKHDMLDQFICVVSIFVKAKDALDATITLEFQRKWSDKMTRLVENYGPSRESEISMEPIEKQSLTVYRGFVKELHLDQYTISPHVNNVLRPIQFQG